MTAGDLTRAEAAQGVRVEAGDILLVRVGHRRRRAVLGPWDAASARAGLHPAAMELVAERRVAVLGSDSNNDTAPSAAEGVDFPVHVLALRALGLMLLDYLQFEDLAATCEAAGRWSFLCVIAPLRLPLGTGSPVNPIAIFVTLGHDGYRPAGRYRGPRGSGGIEARVPLAGQVSGEWIASYGRLAVAAAVPASAEPGRDRAWLVVNLPAGSTEADDLADHGCCPRAAR